ncbi:MDS1 and EVI1 complex locus protein EVI1 [Colletotrichum tanaceti]|uniref:MDS1 and EVI1 complex locus protein EVI1 n=1 Tax=Colletotrichum tanaceti TaxID=1306861 RepID=A0A4V6DGP4_9PEZI|nr:MDS1 and EVI1 complex locus protein EVI1 [Colletotrichum tanaceti]TKW53526.1 MDS1 and EVI1 complex locus protein EVI1 [Colletotrichum tanaceti]
MTFTCGSCWREFPAGWHSRQQHLDATGHDVPDNECDSCDRYFGSRQAVEQHMNALCHWTQDSSSEGAEYQCDDCSDCFSEEEDLHDHEVRDHYYCDPCDRYFQNHNNIRQHLSSKIHRTSTLRCPFCGQTCDTATGLIHHLERGACPNAPLDRERLYEAVRRRDPNGLISKQLLEWHDSPTYEYAATSLTYNHAAGAFECYLCHRLFTTLQGLNMHLNSTAHKQVLYHCPNRRCGRDFKALAGVINHLESESCAFMRFDSVQRNVERIVDPRRMISF